MNNRKTLRFKLLFNFILTITVLLLTMSFANYFMGDRVLEKAAIQELESITNSVSISIENTINAQISMLLHTTADNIKKIIDYHHKNNKNSVQSSVFDSVFKTGMYKVGKDGYATVFDETGKVIIHPHLPKGTDLSHVDIVKKSIELKIGYFEYMWKNPNENIERKKVASFVYYEPLKWHIIMTAYKDDFLNMMQITDFKDIISKHTIGQTGYIYVANLKDCSFAIHPNPSLIGKNMQEVKSTDGINIGSTICPKKNGVMFYDWIDPGKTFARKKIAAFRTISELNWTIVSTTYFDELENLSSGLRYSSLIILVIGLLISILVIYKRSTTLLQPIHHTIDGLKIISTGNIQSKLDTKTNDELGDLTNMINQFTEKLHSVISIVKKTIFQIEKSASNVNTASEKFVQNSQTQSESITEIDDSVKNFYQFNDSITQTVNAQFHSLNSLTDSIKELSNSMQSVNKSMKEISSLTDSISTHAEEGSQSIDSMTKSIDRIDQSSKKITDIVRIINDISNQINLLALNASIEAARAGDVGRGFDVVAGEISKLADKTATSLKDINELVHKNTEDIKNGSKIANNTIHTISNIINDIKLITNMIKNLTSLISNQIQINQLVNESLTDLSDESVGIKNSIFKQKESVKHISDKIDTFNQLSRSYYSSGEAIINSFQEIVKLSSTLNQSISYFKD